MATTGSSRPAPTGSSPTSATSSVCGSCSRSAARSGFSWRWWPTRSAAVGARAPSPARAARPHDDRLARRAPRSTSPGWRPRSTSTTSASLPRRRRRCASPRQWPWSTRPSTAPPTPSRVRPLGSFRSGHNLPNVGLYVWPLYVYPLTRAMGAPPADPPDGRWFVDPVGIDHAMAGPRCHRDRHRPSGPKPNTPGLAAPAAATRGARRTPRADRPRTVVSWFSPATRRSCCSCRKAPATDPGRPRPALGVRPLRLDLRPAPGAGRPVLGRVAVAAGREVERAPFLWSPAFGADIGAGPYPRRPRPGEAVDTTDYDFQLGVSATDDPEPARSSPPWPTPSPPGTTGKRQRRSPRAQGPHRRDGQPPLCRGSHWGRERGERGPGKPARDRGGALARAGWRRPPRSGAVDPSEVRPCLAGSIEVAGTGTGEGPGIVAIDGLLVTGSLT